MAKLRVLVVDDSGVFRQILSRVLKTLPDVEVVGTAPHGKVALAKLDTLEVDAITLDVEMPVLDGLETLEALVQRPSRPEVVMVSSLTTHNADATIKALQLGAYDFVTKPAGSDRGENERALLAQLKPIFSGLATRAILRRSSTTAMGHRAVGSRTPTPLPTPTPPTAPNRATSRITTPRQARPLAVAVGVSTGGPVALASLLPALPKTFPLPILLVQHMPPRFTLSLAESLQKKSTLEVLEARDGLRPKAGTVYIAPGGKQMRVAAGATLRLEITDDPAENNCRPAVDYLFRSLAPEFGPRIIAVIMTGMGADGVEGVRALKARGARAIAQDKASCVVYGMPGEVAKAGLADEILPLDEIAPRLVDLAGVRSAV